MIWGMPTMVEFDSMQENVALCSRLGLRFVEINMNLPMFQAESLVEAARAAERCGIGVTIHLDENFNAADFNPLIADAYLETLRLTLRAAKEIGAPVVNMHLSKGVHFKLPDRKVFLFDHYREVYLERMRRLRGICEEGIGGADIRVCVENTDGYMNFQKDAVALLLESDLFGLTWDIGHSASCASPKKEEEYLLMSRSRLSHFHIHDTKNGRCHLTLGTGEADLDKYLSLAQERGACCVLETKTAAALEKSVIWLRNHGWMQ